VLWRGVGKTGRGEETGDCLIKPGIGRYVLGAAIILSIVLVLRSYEERASSIAALV